MSLHCEQTGRAGFIIHDGAERIAEVCDLRLIFARFRPGGDSFIGPEVPLPLFWMQYAHHEDPERNAGSNPSAIILATGTESVRAECSGTTASGGCLSRYTLTVSRRSSPVAYTYTIEAQLDVVNENGWHVTPNPEHGEVEFANVWPAETFVSNPGGRKRFQACLVAGREQKIRIPHHHLDSPEKHNLPLTAGDRFLWVLEDENPCLTVESKEPVSAGVCAYMWDAHFGFKVTSSGAPVLLPRGTSFTSVYSLSAVGRAEAEALLAEAASPDRPVDSPVYVDGVNRFSEPSEPVDFPRENDWPWEKETSGASELSVDRSRGYDDSASLRIRRTGAGHAAWRASAFGPAYGQPPFPDGARYRLTACVMTHRLGGNASIAVRLHREGKGSVFDLADYETFVSIRRVTGSSGWVMLEAATPPISPAADRLHLLLSQEGEGSAWFDNVLLEVL